MRKLISLLCILLLYFTSSLFAQSGIWTWMHGSNTTSLAIGNYGTIGVPSPTNDPPGRYQAAYWTDLQGNFWIFGGVYNSDQLNDLWKYDVSTNTWTWVGGPQYLTSTTGIYGTKGVPSSTTWPGGTGWGANCWTDHNGDLWLFGGYGYDATGSVGALNDLWRYNIATNQWTWMSGSGAVASVGNFGTIGVPAASNLPPGLDETKSSYVDLIGNLWMFGGSNYNAMWRYNISTNQWTWMNGSSTAGALASYGTINVPSATNVPSGRNSYTKWVDQSGNFYVFSGDGITNDTWQYNPVTNLWTWIGGNSYVGDSGLVNGFCNNSSYPKAVYENRTVQTFGCGNFFWEFGGLLSNGIWGNPLWFYDAVHNKWSLTSGTQNYTSYGSFGIQGTPNSSNVIPSKIGPCMWMDNNANVWVFGGYSYDSTMSIGFGNDIWRYQPDTSCIHVSLSVFGNTTIDLPKNITWCNDQDTTVNISGVHVIKVTPAATAHFSSDSTHLIFHPFQTTTYYLTLTGGCAGKDTETVSFTITFNPTPIAEFISSADVILSNSPIVLFTNQSQYATNVVWKYDGQIISTSNSVSLTLKTLGQHCVTLYAYNALGCYDSITHCVTLVPGATVTLPNAFSPNHDGRNDLFFPDIYGDVVIKEFKIYNRWGQLVFSNPNGAWDGTFNGVEQPISTFTYFLIADKRNIEGNYEKVELKGNVTLMR